ncbi:MAG: Rab family GTPase [Promethearchaeota archaeon]|jgi:small GTP-binding protein
MHKQREMVIQRRSKEQYYDFQAENYITGRVERIFKVIVIGDPHVGRRSLFMDLENFGSEYISTVGVSFSKKVVGLEENTVMGLMLWNIATQPHFSMLHRSYFNGASGIILVYDVTRSSSFANINKWYSSCIKNGLGEVPRILIGNKADLVDEKKIILPMAEHLSKKLDAPFFETSALTGCNVNEAFHKIAELIWNSKV